MASAAPTTYKNVTMGQNSKSEADQGARIRQYSTEAHRTDTPPMATDLQTRSIAENRCGPKRRCRFVIEPVMMLYLATYSVMYPLTSQYVLHVMNEEYNVTGGLNTTCGQVDKSSPMYQQQQKAQAASSQFTLLYNLTQGIPAMFVALFLGSYTDRRGRRLALILPTVTIIIRCLTFIIQQVARLPLWVTIIGTTIEGLGGTASIMLSTCYAYIADTVPLERRSHYILVADVVSNVLQGCFQLGLGYIIKGIGYMWPFVVLTALHSINLVYILLFVPESRNATSDKALTPYMIVESFKTVLRKRTLPRPRSMLLLCLAGFLVLSFGQGSQWGIENVYLLNSPLCMDSILVGYWKFARLMWQCLVATLFSLFVMPRIGDGPIVMISGMSVVVYFIVLPFSTKPWHAFIALVPGFGARMNLPVARAMLSKLVTADEQGGLLSVLYVLSKFLDIIGNAVFKNVYAATLLVFRGTTFMCFAALTLIGVLLTGLFFVKNRRMVAVVDQELEKKEEEDDKQKY